MNKVLVWNLHLHQFVELKKYMRYDPFIWTNSLNYTEEDWKQL